MSKRARRMNRREADAAAQGAIVAANDNKSRAIEVFSFGDPAPVLSRATMLDMMECWQHQRWSETPIPLDGLARAFRASPHPSSAIILTRNMLSASLTQTPRPSRGSFAVLECGKPSCGER